MSFLAPRRSLLRLHPTTTAAKRAVVAGEQPLQGAVDPDLLASWTRSRAEGVDPDGSHLLEHAVAGAAETRSARERTDPVWRRTRTILEDFAGACARRDYVTLLTDAGGVVARSIGGGSFADEARRLRLVEGSLWSEGLRGTNAIGTAIAAQRPTVVDGAAHYARVNEGLVCYAAPIRDPFGQIVAVLDATSRAERAPALDASVVLTVARAVEEVLRIDTYGQVGGSVELVERLLDRSAAPAVLVERPGRIVRASDAARALLEDDRDVEALLDWESLARIATGAADGLCTVAGRELELRVEPITTAAGDLLALLVFLQPGQVRTIVPAAPSRADAFAGILGEDEALVEARETCARLARSDLSVLLLAETGTGKELFARAIHAASPRRDGPYVAVNCGAIQPELLLSELFGHAPQAFTGAGPKGHEGLLAAADGGTLFLDEVAELSLEAQVALLRALEDGRYTRVGETAERRADLRIVAATSRDLARRVETGAFRPDLYYRIGAACVPLPALRDRTDRESLMQRLWTDVRAPDGSKPPSLSSAALALLSAYAWPGNVRELESVLGYAAVMSEGQPEVLPEHLPRSLQASTPSSLPAARGDLDDARRARLVAALRESGGNVSAAARRLGVARSTVYRLARRYGLEPLGSDARSEG